VDETTMMALGALALEAATGAGASGAFAGVGRTRQVDLAVRGEALETVSESTSQSLVLEVWVDGRYATTRTTDLRPDEVARLAREAVALARALQPDPSRAIPDPSLFAGRAELDLELADASIPALSHADREALCRAASAPILGQAGLISTTSACSDGEGLSVQLSSNGFSGSHRRTWLWLSSEVTLQDAAGRPEGWMSAGGPHRSQLPAPAEIGAEALKRARDRLGSRKGPSGRTTLVVEARVAGQILSRLLSPANGANVQQGRSFWAGRLDQPAVSPALVVRDEPLLARMPGSRLFDGEGIRAATLPLIEGGALRNLYLDTTYARRLGMAPTTGSASNRVVQPGSRDLAALVAGVEEGVLVSSWLGGNSDPTSGDFSLGMRGNLIRKGQLGEPVSEMNVTGNLLALFAGLAEVGSDPWPWGSTRCPSLVFEGVDTSGA